MWEWVNLEAGIIEIPAGVTKTDDALMLPLSSELLAMLNKRFKDDSPIFDSMNFRKEWEKACVKISKGVMIAIDRKSTRLNSSHQIISYAVFCLKKKNHI